KCPPLVQARRLPGVNRNPHIRELVLEVAHLATEGSRALEDPDSSVRGKVQGIRDQRIYATPNARCGGAGAVDGPKSPYVLQCLNSDDGGRRARGSARHGVFDVDGARREIGDEERNGKPATGPQKEGKQDREDEGSQHHGVTLPNGSRLSCGRLARRRKIVGRSPCPARGTTLRFLKAITARRLQALVRRPATLLALSSRVRRRSANAGSAGPRYP